MTVEEQKDKTIETLWPLGFLDMLTAPGGSLLRTATAEALDSLIEDIANRRYTQDQFMMAINIIAAKNIVSPEMKRALILALRIDSENIDT